MEGLQGNRWNMFNSLGEVRQLMAPSENETFNLDNLGSESFPSPYAAVQDLVAVPFNIKLSCALSGHIPLNKHTNYKTCLLRRYW